ncbi:Alpha/Beta hydrolase protein [Mycena epipterygia]|nr:Alpha/Beta hydrolase protein [Mycena epipterygia]
MSQYAHLSTPDPEFLDAWSKLPTAVTQPGPIEIATQRHYMTAVAVPQIKETLRPHLPPDSSYSVENRIIPVDGGEISIRCIQPVPRADETGGFPILVWLHGGGWASGDLDIDDYHLRIISVDFRLSIVNVDYRLAPEHPFPAGLNDSYAALKWTATHAADISGSLAKGFLVGGASAGANYAAALAHRARDDPFFAERKLTGHILQVPMVLHPAAYPEELKPELLSIEQNKDAPVITRANIDFFLDCLRVDPSDPEFSSLLLSHKNLSPAYIQVSGLDPLRDEGILYEKQLRESNVKTRLDVYPGVPHAFHVSFPQLAASQKWEADFRAGLGWLLSGP